MIDELLSVYRLKDEVRAGWLLRSVSAPESVADHSWGTALLCLLHAHRAGVDADRAVRIALIHDIAEAEVGDIPRRVEERAQPISRAEKTRREEQAMARLADGPLSGAVALWQEYEAGETPEAVFVRDMNLVDMCLQALFYERHERRQGAADHAGAATPHAGAAHAGAASVPWPALDEFFETARPRVVTAVARELCAEIEARYRRIRAGREQ